jgi:hypothetical protein
MTNLCAGKLSLATVHTEIRRTGMPHRQIQLVAYKPCLINFIKRNIMDEEIVTTVIYLMDSVIWYTNQGHDDS